MNKSILAIAVIASIAAPAAIAAPTVYGNIHLTISDQDTKENPDMTSNTSAIGVKGSEDLGDGMKAIYKMEFQVNVSDGGAGALTNRDQFVGLKGGMGTVAFGTMSSNYKQKGGKVDSLYRTPAEGRGLIHTQSNLHNGRAINRGRTTNQVQYSSPKMGGMQLVANTTFSNSEEESFGVGLRYATKGLSVFADVMSALPIASNIGGSVDALAARFEAELGGDEDAAKAAANAAINENFGSGDKETAFKVGGKFSTKAFHVAGQFESAEDLTGYNYIHVNAGFNINKNNSVQATVGQATHQEFDEIDTFGIALAYNHKLSKMTNVYVAYADRSADDADFLEDDIITFGIKKKF